MNKNNIDGAIKNLTKNQIAKKYEQLVHKIAWQLYDYVQLCREDVLGYAWEGLAYAINNYDPQKAHKKFKEYAAYMIRFSILNGNTLEGSTVRLPESYRSKLKENNKSLWIMRPLEIGEDEDGNTKYSYEPVSKPQSKNISDVYDRVYDVLESRFNKRDCEIFYEYMGLKDYDALKGVEISKKYKVSNAWVSLKIKMMIEYIKSDKDLIEELKEFI